MHLDPPLQMIADLMESARAQAPPPDTQTIDDIRAEANATMMLLHLGRATDMQIDDRLVPADPPVAVRITRPANLPSPAPTVLFIHGGGWVQGDLDTAEIESGPLASAVPCLGISVDYRLAPEHPFPAALDDCLAVYRWVHAHAGDLGVDPSRVAVAGTSAGGNLAAALCLAARDAGLPMPVAQILDVPATDLTLGSPSMDEYATGAGLTKADVERYVAWYLGPDGDPMDPRVSPVLGDLHSLPPAFVIVAEHDPVRDDGERYVRALHAAGVPAACFRVTSHFHGGWIIPNTMTSGLVHDVRVAALRRAFDATLVPPLTWR